MVWGRLFPRPLFCGGFALAVSGAAVPVGRQTFPALFSLPLRQDFPPRGVPWRTGGRDFPRMNRRGSLSRKLCPFLAVEGLRFKHKLSSYGTVPEGGAGFHIPLFLLGLPSPRAQRSFFAMIGPGTATSV